MQNYVLVNMHLKSFTFELIEKELWLNEKRVNNSLTALNNSLDRLRNVFIRALFEPLK